MPTPTRTITTEFWRWRYLAQQRAKYELSVWLAGKFNLSHVVGHELWRQARAGIVLEGRRLRAMEWTKEGVSRTTVGRLIGRRVVISPRAPRWLLNWAKAQPGDFAVILSPMTKRKLMAHLAAKRLREAAG